MNKLARGMMHGAIYAVVFCVLVLMLTPVFNIFLILFIIAGIAIAFVFGIGSNLRSSQILCGKCGRTFPAISRASKCPDCGWSRKEGPQS